MKKVFYFVVLVLGLGFFSFAEAEVQCEPQGSENCIYYFLTFNEKSVSGGDSARTLEQLKAYCAQFEAAQSGDPAAGYDEHCGWVKSKTSSGNSGIVQKNIFTSATSSGIEEVRISLTKSLIQTLLDLVNKLTEALAKALSSGGAQKMQIPEPVATQKSLKATNGKLSVDFKVYFVDKLAGKSEPIAYFPIEGSFGPGCNPYTLGPGEKLESNLEGLCEWRQKLLAEKFVTQTNSFGEASVGVRIPSVPSNITDPLGKSWIAGAVTPGFNQNGASKDRGWDPAKFEFKYTVNDRGSHWEVTLEYVGYRGDTPLSFRTNVEKKPNFPSTTSIHTDKDGNPCPQGVIPEGGFC